MINFQITEERALATPPDDLPHHSVSSYRQNQSALLASVPVPPTLPRHLEKVILNTTPKELEGAIGGQGGDDNSILPVPNHVVLQHLTASAIKNGTLAVGTTTRYKRKVSLRSVRREEVRVIIKLIAGSALSAVYLDDLLQACGRILDRRKGIVLCSTYVLQVFAGLTRLYLSIFVNVNLSFRKRTLSIAFKMTSYRAIGSPRDLQIAIRSLSLFSFP